MKRKQSHVHITKKKQEQQKGTAKGMAKRREWHQLQLFGEKKLCLRDRNKKMVSLTSMYFLLPHWHCNGSILCAHFWRKYPLFIFIASPQGLDMAWVLPHVIPVGHWPIHAGHHPLKEEMLTIRAHGLHVDSSWMVEVRKEACCKNEQTNSFYIQQVHHIQIAKFWHILAAYVSSANVWSCYRWQLAYSHLQICMLGGHAHVLNFWMHVMLRNSCSCHQCWCHQIFIPFQNTSWMDKLAYSYQLVATHQWQMKWWYNNHLWTHCDHSSWDLLDHDSYIPPN